MEQHTHIAFAQLNFLVGDIAGNADKMIAAAAEARKRYAAEVIAFSELSLTGYSPEDLLLRSDFINEVEQGIARLCRHSSDIAMLVGAPVRDGDKLCNSMLYLKDGKVAACYAKNVLPNSEVFDEVRYFTAGSKPGVIDLGGVRAGLIVCRDAWETEPIMAARAAGASVIIDINASPFYVGKDELRKAEMQARVKESGLPVIYVNGVGGQDELVFDGASFIVNASGEVVFSAPAFEEGVYSCEVSQQTIRCDVPSQPVLSDVESVWRALRLGLSDYIRKNHFSGAVVGVSGGIDSAVVLALAADSLGADRVTALIMPSRHNSPASMKDAADLADKLGVRSHTIQIDAILDTILDKLSPVLGTDLGVAGENIQARIRGLLLMAVSNKDQLALLATGNKSEMAVGYATLYGDMAGAFAPIKDVVKTSVYEIAEFLNQHEELIPRGIIEREPSAELAPGQKDSDSLPDYEVLDEIVEKFVESDLSLDAIVAHGYPEETVNLAAAMVLKNEFKRRQCPVGPKVTSRAFGKDRRYPITCHSDTLFKK